MQFMGLSYRLILEEEGRGTAMAVLLSSMIISPDEDIFVTSSDLMVRGDGYSDAIYQAKELSKKDHIVLFGVLPQSSRQSVGYIRKSGDRVCRFIEKPSCEIAKHLFLENDVLWNSGMFIAQNSTLRSEFAALSKNLMEKVERIIDALSPDEAGNILVPSDLASDIAGESFEKVILEQSEALSVVRGRFDWNDVSDYASYGRLHEDQTSDLSIKNACYNTDIINTSFTSLVVANNLNDTIIVNTPNAVYVTDRDHADDIRSIIFEHHDDYRDFFDHNPRTFRPWGTREIICQDYGFRVRRVEIYPGMTMTMHSHQSRTENYSVVSGTLSVQLTDAFCQLEEGQSINILPGRMHRLYNTGDKSAVVIEVDTGAEIIEQDMVGMEEKEKDDHGLPHVLRMKPAFKDYIWGGTRLNDIFHKNSPFDITAESWELSAHPDGQSVICGGPFDGEPFGDFIARYKSDVCGWKSEVFDRFPVLIKFIDARNPLSIQIHPGDDYAFVNEGEFGKNEVWYVMDAEEGAYLYCGLSRDVSVDELEKRIADHTITEVLNKIEVKAGDVVFVPAGTIHAIGGGLLICEIQQNSNSTYRMYDYGRLDKNGNPRQLHIKKALDVVNTEKYDVNTKGFRAPVKHEKYTDQVIVQCKYFRCTKYTVDEEVYIPVDDSSFKSVLILSGNGKMVVSDDSFDFAPGDSFFVTAGRKLLWIKGRCEVIVTNV